MKTLNTENTLSKKTCTKLTKNLKEGKENSIPREESVNDWYGEWRIIDGEWERR